MGRDGERESCRVLPLTTDPRQSEVVRTSRLNAEEAEFGHEDTEELSGAL